MANPNSPFGFRPIARTGGGPWSINQYGKPATDTNYAIFMNDPVMKAAASVADPTGVGSAAPGIASFSSGTPGTTLWVGVSLNWGAISTATVHYVADEPDLITMAQVDDTTSISVASHVGKNANCLAGAGSATTKQSAYTINHSTIAAGSGTDRDVRVLALSSLQPNVAGGYAILECLCIKHFYANVTVGV